MPGLHVYLVSVFDDLFGDHLHLKVAAYDRQDAEGLASVIDYPVVIVDEIPRGEYSLDNHFLVDRAVGRCVRHSDYPEQLCLD